MLLIERPDQAGQVDPPLSIKRQCELLGLARSTVYYEPKEESEENEALMKLLDEQYTQTPFYGVRRMTAWLRSEGHMVNSKRVSRLLRKMGLWAIYPGPSTSKAAPDHRIYPYLLRNVPIQAVNQVWSTDITYIRMRRGYERSELLSGCRDTLVLKICAFVEVGNQLGGELLCRGAGSGIGDRKRAASGVQLRPGEPVHKPGFHRSPAHSGDQYQHGWNWAGRWTTSSWSGCGGV